MSSHNVINICLCDQCMLKAWNKQTQPKTLVISYTYGICFVGGQSCHHSIAEKIAFQRLEVLCLLKWCWKLKVSEVWDSRLKKFYWIPLSFRNYATPNNFLDRASAQTYLSILAQFYGNLYYSLWPLQGFPLEQGIIWWKCLTFYPLASWSMPFEWYFRFRAGLGIIYR